MIQIYPGMTYGQTLIAKRKAREDKAAAKAANVRAAHENGSIVKIMGKLHDMFTELDAKMIVNQKRWVKERAAAIKAFEGDLANRQMRRDKGEWAYYNQLFTIAGGKTWYNVISGRNQEALDAFVEKNCAAIAEKRNATITRKLVELGITKVREADVGYTSDGFHGSFGIETRDHGRKTITIQTIYAGGYNIQCFHQRTLVKVR